MDSTSIEPDNIHVSEYNERQETLDENELETLTQSVRENGVINPVVLRESQSGDNFDEEYEVIIGQRRVAAARNAELFSIPAVIVDWSNENALVSSITENVTEFDQNVSTKDRAEAVLKLWEVMDGDGSPNVAALSERLGVSDATVRRWLEPTRDEWEGTQLQPDITDDDGDGDDDGNDVVEEETVVDDDENDDNETDEVSDGDGDADDDTESIEQEWDDEISDGDADEDSDDESDEPVLNTEERPEDANEFDDDPIDQVGTIDVDDDRQAEDDDGSDYDGPDSYTDGAESKPGLNNGDNGPGAGKLEDPEERDTEVPEPEDSDGTDEETEPMDNLRPELEELSPDKVASVRRMTGGGEEGIAALEKVKEYGLSNQQVREAASRVKNGAAVDVALETVAEEAEQDGPRVRVQFTISGEVAEAAQQRAKERSTSVNEVANDALHQVLFPDDTDPDKLFNED